MLEIYQFWRSHPCEKSQYFQPDKKSFSLRLKSLSKCLMWEYTLQTKLRLFCLIKCSKQGKGSSFSLPVSSLNGALVAGRGDSTGCVISSGAGREAGREYLWDRSGHIFPAGGAWIIQTPTHPPESQPVGLDGIKNLASKDPGKVLSPRTAK